MSFNLLPLLKAQFTDSNGDPASGWKLYSYLAGSATATPTYTDSTGNTQNTNPIILNARGEANVWLSSAIAYKFVLKDNNDVEIYSTDNVTGGGSIGLIGPQGPQGPQGVAGVQGSIGAQGVAGVQGDIGVQGPAGEQGSRGYQGDVGEKGDPGVQGPAGNDGAIGPQGVEGPQGMDGIGVPDGGTTGQVLVKASNVDHDTEWSDTLINNDEAINGIYGLRNYQQNFKRSSGVILPLYIYPTDPVNNVSYNTVIDLAKQYREIPTIVAVNPSSGPGAVEDGNYTAAIDRLVGADITVIGYVSSDYMARDINLVKADCLTWTQLYPAVRGIWVDEMPNGYGAQTVPDIIAYYKEIYDYCKKELNLDFVYTNPGTTFDKEIWDGGVADNIVMYETSGYPTENQLLVGESYYGSLFEMPAHAKSILCHTCASWDETSAQLIRKYAGWIFVTDQIMPNPYNTLTPYLEDMYKAMSVPLTDSGMWEVTTLDGESGIFTPQTDHKTTYLGATGSYETMDSGKLVVSPNAIDGGDITVTGSGNGGEADGTYVKQVGQIGGFDYWYNSAKSTYIIIDSTGNWYGILYSLTTPVAAPIYYNCWYTQYLVTGSPVGIYTGNNERAFFAPVAAVQEGQSSGTAIRAYGLVHADAIQTEHLQTDTQAYIPIDPESTQAVWQEGKVWYNADKHVLQQYSDIVGTMLDIGEENRVRVHNNTGSTIVEGSVVYVSGATGDRPTIALASNAIEAQANRVIGVMTTDTDNGDQGYCVLNGTIHDIDTSAWNEGDLLYLSATPGQLTNVVPEAPAAIVCCAIVTRDNANNGSICVNPKRIYEIPFRSISKDGSGWDTPETITESYDYSTRQITVSGTGRLFWQGNLVWDLTTNGNLVSVAHTATQGSWFYYYDGSNFVWSQSPWSFEQAMIGYVYYNASTPNTSWGVRECHSLMDWRTHRELHNRIGTYKSGTGAVIAGFTSGSTTLRQPTVTACTVYDEDLPTTIAAHTTQTNYTIAQLANGVNPELNVFTNQATIRGTAGDIIYYDMYDGVSSWTQTQVANGKYVNFWLVAIPVMGDIVSQAYRYVWLRPQSIHDTLQSARGENAYGLFFGSNISTLTPEMCIVGVARVYVTGNNWSITESAAIDVSRQSIGSTMGAAGLVTVSHDSSLTGDGTVTTPLSVNEAFNQDWTVHQEFNQGAYFTRTELDPQYTYNNVPLKLMGGAIIGTDTFGGGSQNGILLWPTSTTSLHLGYGTNDRRIIAGTVGAKNAVQVNQDLTLDPNNALVTLRAQVGSAPKLELDGTNNAYKATLTQGSKSVVIDSQGVKPSTNSGIDTTKVLSLDANNALQYGSLSSTLGNYLPLAGGAMAGNITAAGTMLEIGSYASPFWRLYADQVNARPGATGDVSYSIHVDGQQTYSYYQLGDGKMWWGDGTDLNDTNLYRSAANVLKTDDAFTVGGDLTTNGFIKSNSGLYFDANADDVTPTNAFIFRAGSTPTEKFRIDAATAKTTITPASAGSVALAVSNGTQEIVQLWRDASGDGQIWANNAAGTNTFKVDGTNGQVTITPGESTAGITFSRSGATAGDDIGYLTYEGKDSVGNTTQYGRSLCDMTATTDGAEMGSFVWQTAYNGSLATQMALFGNEKRLEILGHSTSTIANHMPPNFRLRDQGSYASWDLGTSFGSYQWYTGDTSGPGAGVLGEMILKNNVVSAAPRPTWVLRLRSNGAASTLRDVLQVAIGSSDAQTMTFGEQQTDVFNMIGTPDIRANTDPVLNITDADAASGGTTSGLVRWRYGTTEVAYLGRKDADASGVHKWYNAAGDIELEAAGGDVAFKDSKIGFRSGTGSIDTNLYRNAADVLKTDDSLIVAANTTLGTNNTNTVTINGVTGGTLDTNKVMYLDGSNVVKYGTVSSTGTAKKSYTATFFRSGAINNNNGIQPAGAVGSTPVGFVMPVNGTIKEIMVTNSLQNQGAAAVYRVYFEYFGNGSQYSVGSGTDCGYIECSLDAGVVYNKTFITTSPTATGTITAGQYIQPYVSLVSGSLTVTDIYVMVRIEEN